LRVGLCGSLQLAAILHHQLQEASGANVIRAWIFMGLILLALHTLLAFWQAPKASEHLNAMLTERNIAPDVRPSPKLRRNYLINWPTSEKQTAKQSRLNREADRESVFLASSILISAGRELTQLLGLDAQTQEGRLLSMQTTVAGLPDALRALDSAPAPRFAIFVADDDPATGAVADLISTLHHCPSITAQQTPSVQPTYAQNRRRNAGHSLGVPS
jgi:hypothetical protein